MEVVELTDPGEFLQRAQALLLADEARHNLLLGIAGSLRDNAELYREHRLWLVLDAGEVVGVALRTPPHNLVLARPRVPQAQQALASAIGGPLPGVTAALPEADGFADAWQAKTGTRRRVRVSQKIYALEHVRPVEDVPGSARVAAEADRPLLRLWLRHFGLEALQEVQDEERTERLLDHRLGQPEGARSAGFAIWEDGLPVSLAGFSGETPNGVRIGPVYTPPVLRGRGYGSAVTAAVSAERLASGRRFCFLYTDAANPTSNKIYTNVGYEPVCDAVDYAFY